MPHSGKGVTSQGCPFRDGAEEHTDKFATDETVQEKLGEPPRLPNMSLLSISDDPRRYETGHPGGRHPTSAGRGHITAPGQDNKQKRNLQNRYLYSGEFDPGSG